MSKEGGTVFETESGGGTACVLERGMALVGSLFEVPKQVSSQLRLSVFLTHCHAAFFCSLEKLLLALPDPSSVFL
jgi:hypothetical protein